MANRQSSSSQVTDSLATDSLVTDIYPSPAPGLANYPAMKDSDADWFGDIPEHWEMRRTKYLFSERVEKGYPNEPLLAATQTKGVVLKELYEIRTVTAQKDFHLLKLVEIGDFVISLRSFQGGIEIAFNRGIISPAYTVMAPSNSINREYFKHLFKSKYFINGLTTFVTGIREGQNIDYSKFKNSFLPLPPLAEQTAIANFLDRKTGQIDAFVALKEKTIALLEEQKTAIINAAVTQGLNPAAPLKDSGIEWLGEVPAHWEVKPLAWVARLQRGHDLPNSEREDGPFPIISSSGVSGYHSVAKAKGPGVVTGRYGTIGKIIYVESDYWPLNTSLYVIEFYENYPRYIYYMLQILPFDAHSGKSAVPGVNRNDLHVLSVVCPPLAEQHQIVAHIEQATAKIDRAIAQAQQQIDLIKEYREALISQAVTGKIKVIDN